MNFFEQLDCFYSISIRSNKITAHHISLYLALLYQWNKNFFISPFDIYRDTVLSFSKIGSTHTYYKCINELQIWNFIHYEPSQNGIIASRITVHELDEKRVKKILVCLSKIDTSNAQSITQALSKIDISTNTSSASINKHINNKLLLKKNNKKDSSYLKTVNTNATTQKRKKVAQKKENPELIQLPFSSSEFLSQWHILLSLPKWSKKPIQSINSIITRISRYEEAFVIQIIESAIAGNWQGLIFPNTDELYKNYLKSKSINHEDASKGTRNQKPDNGGNQEFTKNYKQRF